MHDLNLLCNRTTLLWAAPTDHRKSTTRNRSCSAIDILKTYGNARFLAFAASLDKEFASDLKQKDCPFCKGPLNSAYYQRKSRFPVDVPLPEGWNTFYSLCCSKEGCRRRSRPFSIRYAGRSPHSAGVLLLCNLLRTGGAQRAVLALCKEFLVSERTVQRWMRFWKAACLRARWWRELAGRIEIFSGSINCLFKKLRAMHPLELSCEILARESVNLWGEIRINIGDRVYAEDA